MEVENGGRAKSTEKVSVLRKNDTKRFARGMNTREASRQATCNRLEIYFAKETVSRDCESLELTSSLISYEGGSGKFFSSLFFSFNQKAFE